MERQYQTETIAELFAALAKAQTEITHAAKAADNPHFRSKYADLPAVMDAARPHLAKNGLSVTQITDFDLDGNMFLMTQLSHSTGQWIRSWYPIKPVQNNPQGIGSALTYARRYSYCAMVGVAADDDDDGNAASSGIPHKEAQEPKSLFKTATARKQFCEGAIAAYKGAESLEELATLMEGHKPLIDGMKTSGNHYDELGVNELRTQYSAATTRLKTDKVVSDKPNGGLIFAHQLREDDDLSVLDEIDERERAHRE